jgi:hypothetical protein
MARRMRIRTSIPLLFAIVFLFGVAPSAYTQTAETSKAAPPAVAKEVKTKKTKKTVAPLNIQGFRIGMTASEVKQLLQKKKIRGYETGFSDVLAYSPSPGTELKLLLTCGAKGNILGKVELTTAFTTEEAELAVAKFNIQLIAKYGTPLFSGSHGDLLDFCWGQCEQGANGIKLTAVTTTPQGDKRSLALTLGNDALIQACAEMRPKKINSWLYQWIDAVQKFNPGMSLKDAAKLYQKRYQNALELDEEKDEAAQQYAVKNYVAKDYDFFTALDYESQAFEGIELGAIVLKFTGDQAGSKDAILNKKLYYTSFSTTKFSDQHVYADVQQKLDKFIKIYGKPAEVVPQPGGITARWQQDSKQRSVSIFDSGLITFEQSDPALKDAYRDAAVRNISEYNKTRFDRPIF